MIRTQCENIHSIYKYGYGTGLIVSCNFEPRPGIDRRDEVLHGLERAQTREQAHAAAHQFLRWLEELEIVE